MRRYVGAEQMLTRYIGLIAACLAVVWVAGGADAQRERWPVSAPEAVARSIAQPDAPLDFMAIEMNVCGSGESAGRGYLNSKADYRDPRSLNVELMPDVRQALAEQLGGDPVDILLNKRIVVFGQLRQVRIEWMLGGEPMGASYAQTQMQLQTPGLLEPVIAAGELAPADCTEVTP
jgi:hypothetical protein